MAIIPRGARATDLTEAKVLGGVCEAAVDCRVGLEPSCGDLVTSEDNKGVRGDKQMLMMSSVVFRDKKKKSSEHDLCVHAPSFYSELVGWPKVQSCPI